MDSISDFIKQTPEEKPDSSGQPGPKSARKKQAAPGQKTETAGPSSRLRFEDEGKPDGAGPDTSGQVGPKHRVWGGSPTSKFLRSGRKAGMSKIASVATEALLAI